MAIIGNTTTSVPFIADSFSGNASTTSFSPLTRAPAGTAAIAVFISGVYQAPGTYTLSGVTITFASAPASGVGNIIVLHLGNGSATQVPSDGSVTITKLSSDTYGYINAAFATANTGTASGSYANSAFASANLISGVNTTQNTNITNASTYANSAFATANTGTAAGSYANSAFSVANNGVGIDATQNTNITNAGTYANTGFAVANSAALYANSAFSKANGVVTSAVAGTGVSVSAATGAVTFTNSGVTSIVAGSGISISGGTGAVTVTASGGGVTSAVAGNGITVSGATGAVTFSQDFYTGTAVQNTSYPIGTYLLMARGGGATPMVINGSISTFCEGNGGTASCYYGASIGTGSVALSGTWRGRGMPDGNTTSISLLQRTA